MNLLQLVLKNMRQRALGTSLTTLSVVLGMALAVAVLLVREGGQSLFAQTDYGYDLIVGKGSPTQLVLNTVYHIDQSPGNLPYSVYESLLSNPNAPGRPHPQVKLAVPLAVGDRYKGRRIIATLPTYFGYEEDGTRIEDGTDPTIQDRVLRYRKDKRFEFAEGRVFHPKKFEAVIGSEVSQLTGLKLGDKFQASHDAGEDREGHQHKELWEVVGVLGPTRTSNDRVIFIPLVTTFAIEDHDKGMREMEDMRKGRPIGAGRGPVAAAAAAVARAAAPPPPPPPAAATKPKDDDHDHADEHKHEAEEHKHEEHEPKPAETNPPAAHAEGGEQGHHDEKHAEGEKHEGHAEDAHAHHDAHEHGDHPATEHEHASYVYHPDGTIDPKLPKELWAVSAIFVKTRSTQHANQLEYAFRTGAIGTAVRPAMVMAEFFQRFLDGITKVLLLIMVLVCVLGAVSILVSIYNSVSARLREIAILRALGATRGRILTVICTEAGLIGLIGGVLGLLVGHTIGAIGSAYMDRTLGQGFDWWAVGAAEWLFLAGVVLIAVLAGLVPAMKAYRTPVATNLVAV